jgi:ADP-glucose pyrophosphorylase
VEAHLDFLQTRPDLLTSQLERSLSSQGDGLSFLANGSIVARSAVIERGAMIGEGCVVMPDAHVCSGSQLKRTVVLPKVQVPTGSTGDFCIFWKNGQINL